jgi:hypothetical protein
MSKTQTTKAINQELVKLNQIIDQKIIRGMAYAREANRHKSLLSQLGRLQQSNWLTRVATAFLF